MMKKTSTLIAAIGAGLFWSMGANALLIDDFSTGQGPLVDMIGGGPLPTNGVTGAGIIDAGGGTMGQRNITVDAGPSSVGGGDETSVSVIGNALSMSNEDGVDGTVTVLWAGTGGTGLGGVDLTDMGLSDRIGLTVNSIDLSVSLMFTIIDTVAGVSTGTLTFVQTTNFMTSILFSNFVGTADFTTVDSIQLVASSTQASWDGNISFLQSTNLPAPGALALFGLGLIGMAGYSRRRKS